MHIWDGLKNMSRLTVGFIRLYSESFRVEMNHVNGASVVKVYIKIKVEP